MAGYRDESHYKVIEDGVKKDVEVNLEQGRYRAAVILI